MSSYFQIRLEQRMKEAHDRANYPVNRINLAFNESEKRLLKEIKKLYKGMDSVAPQDRIKWLNESISVEEYEQALQILKTTQDKAIRKQMIDMIKANANAGRIRRKTAMLQAIKREQLWMTDKQLSFTKSHLESTFRNVMSELGYTNLSKKAINETLQQRWLGANYSERIWKNQKVLAKKLETELLQGFISGKSYKDMAREMTYLTDVGRYAANRLVRTETSYVVNSADLFDSKRRGIKAKRFEARLDSKTSTLCRNNNQKVLWIEDIKIGENAPPLHPFCRSFLSDMLEGWDYQTEEELAALIKASQDSEQPANTTANQRITIREDEEQYYGKFEKDHNSKGRIRDITYTEVKGDGIKNGTFVSDKVGHIKPREMHETQVLYSNSLKFMNIDKEVAPALLICDDSEFLNNAIATFNPKHNVIRVRKSALFKKKLLDIVNGQVVASDIAESTYIHELFHFKDLMKYKKIKKIDGLLTNEQVKDFMDWVDNRSKNWWNSQNENTKEWLRHISEYAKVKVESGSFDEVYTEYRTLLLLEKMK